MSKAIKIKRGLNIRLKGEAEKVLVTLPVKGTYAIKPTDFHGLVPKMVVKEGDSVKAGSVLFINKYNDRVRFTSPVSGKVTAVVRGEKRKILEVRIEADAETSYESFPSGDPKGLSREEILNRLLQSGLWAFVRQRPFTSVADPADMPKSIFVSSFDTSPLAPDYDFIVHGQGEDFQLGLDAIAKLTSGKVHLNVNGNLGQSKVFSNSKGVQINTVSGPHPAGNVGVQIHHIDPINKGDVIWYVNPQDLVSIGKFFRTGKADFSKVVALTGSEVKNPKYYRLVAGAPMAQLTEGNLNDSKELRIISGNVLTGTQVAAQGNIGYYDNQVTVIEEGNKLQFFLTKGWMGPGFSKFSLSRTFPTWLMPGKKFSLDTNLNGEERAFVVTGQYEKVFPFDIYPVQLLKAIIVNDLEAMENLGIYEVDPEDFALCEFVCTSKINSQQLVRDGLDLVRKECM
ncbi:MAG: Na(+)-translocating NADH-quinone reductase subunit A [Flavobacteriales bacterium]|nr:Na(+)-translocating NADH-quinone reductase subunit A [Flavobacteriales bacterium]